MGRFGGDGTAEVDDERVRPLTEAGLNREKRRRVRVASIGGGEIVCCASLAGGDVELACDEARQRCLFVGCPSIVGGADCAKRSGCGVSCGVSIVGGGAELRGGGKMRDARSGAS